MTKPAVRLTPSWAARALLLALEGYRLLLSPWMGQWCRFEPTCSRYTKQAVETHGAGVGAYLGARRLLRCHPWCPAGLDPVPDPSEWATRRRLFSRLLIKPRPPIETR